jgi:hypothetical protein
MLFLYFGGEIMAGIGHINSTYNPDLKRLSSKLAFQIGERFTARVVKFDESAGEILLKLLDGWNFSAKLDKPLDFSPKGKLMFQIVGMEDGKVIIRLLQGESNASKAELDSLLHILNQNNLGEEGYDVLEKMLQHEIPLNKDNISKVKSIADFTEKIKADSGEEDAFIGKYIVSKGIDENSEDGQFVKTKLKDFFSELKSIDIDDVLTMLENDIDLNTDNIESFKRIFKAEGGLYKSLKNIDDLIKEQFSKELTSSFEKLSNTLEEENFLAVKDSLGDASKEDSMGKSTNNSKVLNNVDAYNNSSLSTKKLNKLDVLKSMLNDTSDVNTILKEIDLGLDVDIHRNIEGTELSDIEKIIKNYNKDELKEALVTKGILREKVEEHVQSIIKNKSDELKEVVKNIISLKTGSEKEVFDRVLDFMKPTINDIKLFNTVNNQYYYMDIPLNFKEQEYPCKLIIKDERGRGKRIDSKNVSMVVSIKTVNLGDVDSYIKVRENNMSIDIKCEEKWIKSLEETKDKLISGLNNLGYNLFINFDKREETVDITTTRNFFNDNGFNNINVKV